MTPIPIAKPEIREEDIAAVVQVLQSNFLTQGPIVERFEEAIARYCEVTYASALSSATAGLHLACMALQLGKGDWLWTSPISFAASANCALYCGANVDFVDIDNNTMNMCMHALERKLQQAQKQSRLPKIIIPVHFAGYPCDMQALESLRKKYGFAVIEDASHALSGKYQGKPIGNCAYSDATIFSFHAIKNITTAEGGMVTTNQPHLHQQIRLLRSHGITKDKALLQHSQEGLWYYEQHALGFNYRMNEIQAVLGLSQLSRLNTYRTQKEILFQNYQAALSTLPYLLPQENRKEVSGQHLYVLRLEKKLLSAKKAIFQTLREKGIEVQVHYIPIYMHPYYQKKGFLPKDFPKAQRHYEEALSLPFFASMQQEEQARVVTELKKALLPYTTCT